MNMLVTVNFKDRLAEPHLGFPQKSFAVLDVLDHHVVLALSFKLVSFFKFIIAWSIGRQNYTQADFFQAFLYRTHRAVIFAIAQLSCCSQHCHAPLRMP